MGRPPHLSPRAPSGLRRRRGRLARRRGLRHRDARRAGLDHQRALRQPPALHLPRLLPAGLQGQRQGQPAHHPPARRDRARRRGPRQRDGGARRDRREQRPGHAASPTSATASTHFQPRRRRRRLRLRDRDPAAAAELHQPPLPPRARQRPRPGRPLRHGPGRHPGRRRAFRWTCACTRRRRPRSPASSSTRPTSPRLRPRVLDPDGLAAADRLGRARPGRRPLGRKPCAPTCATTTTGASSACCASCSPRPTTASRWPTRPTQFGMPVAKFTHSHGRQRQAPTSPTPPRRCRRSGSTPAPRTSSRSTASPTWSAAPAWASPPRTASSTPPTACGESRNLFVVDGSVLPTQGAANPALVIMALADRCARLLADKRVAR